MNARHHLIIRADIMRPPINPTFVEIWLMQLVKSIGMKLAAIPYNPNVYYCHAHGNRGMTATAIIEMSNITLHTWDEGEIGELQLDVFTCADLEKGKVFDALSEFGPVSGQYMLIDRSGGIYTAEIGQRD